MCQLVGFDWALFSLLSLAGFWRSPRAIWRVVRGRLSPAAGGLLSSPSLVRLAVVRCFSTHSPTACILMEYYADQPLAKHDLISVSSFEVHAGGLTKPTFDLVAVAFVGFGGVVVFGCCC